MREQFENIKNGWPWIQHYDAKLYKPTDRPLCRAIIGLADDECYYKNCAILYWLRHLIAYLDCQEWLDRYQQRRGEE